MSLAPQEKKVTKSREIWSKKVDYILSVAGAFVGLGNIWRFPYLCYKNGGGAFLIPYVIFLVCGGIPILCLEVSLGQYMSEGGITVWNILPIGRGVGYATIVILGLLNVYYIIILAWTFFYLFQSFTSNLPWAECGHPWNSACCMETLSESISSSNHSDNGTAVTTISTMISTNHTICNGTRTSPVTEYWERRVLNISSGLDDVGSVRWELALCLLLSWIICYFCIWKGIKYSGKIVYFTATFPYVMLIILLVRGVTLPGAATGISYYLTPNITKLGDIQVWIDAGTQVFFSFALSMGMMVSLGSYNKFHNDCYRDTILLGLINPLTSFAGGFAVFSVLGFMAQEQNVDISVVAESGPGLVFIAYPKAITLMPASTVWSILFFLMIIFLGMDSMFMAVECFVTSVVDRFPQQLRRGKNREIFIAVTCIVSFLLGLTMVTNGGMYVLQLFDYYAASGISLLWVSFFGTIAVGWIYGAERMWQNISRMVGYRPVPFIKHMWIFGTPLITTLTLLLAIVKFEPLVYNKTYVYPAWGTAIGLCLALSSMLVIPAYAIYRMITTPGNFMQRIGKLTTPELPFCHKDYISSEKEYGNHISKVFGRKIFGRAELSSDDIVGAGTKMMIQTVPESDCNAPSYEKALFCSTEA